MRAVALVSFLTRFSPPESRRHASKALSHGSFARKTRCACSGTSDEPCRDWLTCPQEGFIKAFSDEPEHFAGGLSPLQTVLGQLHMRRVELWPRFHKNIIRDLGKRRADVIELHQPLSRSMRNIQNAIVECLDATLGELKRGSSTVSAASADFRLFILCSLSHLPRSTSMTAPSRMQSLEPLRPSFAGSLIPCGIG